MPFVFDNLTATVIASVILLVLANIQLRTERQEVAQTAQQVAQSRAQEATDWLEEDLGRIGQNMVSGQSAVDKPEPYSRSSESSTKKWLTKEFSFRRDSITAGAARWRIETRYRTYKQRTVSIEGKPSPVYGLVRERRKRQVGNGGWSEWEKRGEINSLEYFDIDLLDQNSQPTKALGEAESVRIRFSVVAPFQNEEMAFPASRSNVVVASYPTGD
ncbi:hypothetical protein [Salinibacter ruber]|uniref:Uncharacterized protein n=1 Tax=Salinibacter ruber TaxID=146919 RepID=A0A9X2V7L8_9BACT|nr:hypothetical protein [Salinibacter ruber]MCS4122827.1 hypothetical protein [Salinibacter ruber]